MEVRPTARWTGVALQSLMGVIAVGVVLVAWRESPLSPQSIALMAIGVFAIVLLGICCNRWGFSYQVARARGRVP